MENLAQTEPSPTPPDALLLIASRCPHCQSALEGLTRLVKDGVLGRLTVINVSTAPQAPEVRGIRSVPWTRIGPFELGGAREASELRGWAEAAGTGGGWGRYFALLIEEGRLDTLIERLRTAPATLSDLLDLFAEPATPLPMRIGVSAALEHLAGSELLRGAIPQLLSLTLSESPQVRADTCHFLGLTGDPGVATEVRRLLDDEHPEVREVAAETLALLGAIEPDGAVVPRP
jgi:HEAT repeats